MKLETQRIYAMLPSEAGATIFSGISFADFVECTPVPIENILLLKGDYWGEKSWNKFELLEGQEQIAKLMHENIYRYGDFCFVDYANHITLDELSDDEIAELLYFAHMLKPLKSPFFEALQNSFFYFAHDDGWYCKLYCKSPDIPMSVLVNRLQKSVWKTTSNNHCLLPASLVQEVHKLSIGGVLIELETSPPPADTIATICIYDVGKYTNMDTLFSNLECIKRDSAKQTFALC